MIDLLPDIRKWFEPKREHLLAFALADCRLESWFKGELLVLLGRLQHEGRATQVRREVKLPRRNSNAGAQVDFAIDMGGESHEIGVRSCNRARAAVASCGMARPLRVEFPGAIYHITSRGDGRDDIFLDDDDRQRLLDLLGHTIERFGWRCHAYCLMPNHYHLLLETPEANLSRGMRHLNGVYTQRFNRRHGRVGHVLQGRYKAIVVQKDAHLLELCRYVVLNPVRARMGIG